MVSQLQLFSYADGRADGPAGALYRDLLEQAAAAGVRHLRLEDASHAMVIEQPELLATVIGDFLTAR